MCAKAAWQRSIPTTSLFAQAAAEGAAIAAAYESCDYNKAMRQIMALANRANKYVEERAQWCLREEGDSGQSAELQQVFTVALNLFRQLAVYLAPVLPKLAAQAGGLLNKPIERWESEADEPLVGTPVGDFEHMLGAPVEIEQLEALIEASRAKGRGAAPAGEPNQLPKPRLPTAPRHCRPSRCRRDDQLRRVRQGRSAHGPGDTWRPKKIPKSKKLLRLTLSLGGDGSSNVFTGIRGELRS